LFRSQKHPKWLEFDDFEGLNSKFGQSASPNFIIFGVLVDHFGGSTTAIIKMLLLVGKIIVEVMRFLTSELLAQSTSNVACLISGRRLTHTGHVQA